MSDLISRSALYKKIAELEDLARQRVLDTPTNNPCYLQYVAQLNERTAFKHRVADAPAVEVEVVRCKDCNHWLKDVAGCTEFVGRCEFANYMIGATGFCSYGERRN